MFCRTTCRVHQTRQNYGDGKRSTGSTESKVTSLLTFSRVQTTPRIVKLNYLLGFQLDSIGLLISFVEIRNTAGEKIISGKHVEQTSTPRALDCILGAIASMDYTPTPEKFPISFCAGVVNVSCKLQPLPFPVLHFASWTFMHGFISICQRNRARK